MKKCIECKNKIKRGKTEGAIRYKNRKFCSIRCSAKHQFKNGMSQKHKNAISKGLMGKKPWNTGLKYKSPKQSKTMKEKGHWKKGQTFEERFGKKKAKQIKENLSNFRKSLAQPIDPKYRDYKCKVIRITKQQPINTLKNYEKRGKAKKGTNNYQLDHIIPIRYGYLNKIPAEKIGCFENLRMIHWKENIQRNKNENKFYPTKQKQPALS